MGGDTGNDVSIHIQNATLSTLLFLQSLKNSPQLVGSLGRASQEFLITIIRLVVSLNEVSYINFLFPETAVKAFPLINVHHKCSPPLKMFKNSLGH